MSSWRCSRRRRVRRGLGGATRLDSAPDDEPGVEEERRRPRSEAAVPRPPVAEDGAPAPATATPATMSPLPSGRRRSVLGRRRRPRACRPCCRRSRPPAPGRRRDARPRPGCPLAGDLGGSSGSRATRSRARCRRTRRACASPDAQSNEPIRGAAPSGGLRRGSRRGTSASLQPPAPQASAPTRCRRPGARRTTAELGCAAGAPAAEQPTREADRDERGGERGERLHIRRGA